MVLLGATFLTVAHAQDDHRLGPVIVRAEIMPADANQTTPIWTPPCNYEGLGIHTETPSPGHASSALPPIAPSLIRPAWGFLILGILGSYYVWASHTGISMLTNLFFPFR